jgi:hypothetical protein
MVDLNESLNNWPLDQEIGTNKVSYYEIVTSQTCPRCEAEWDRGLLAMTDIASPNTWSLLS